MITPHTIPLRCPAWRRLAALAAVIVATCTVAKPIGAAEVLSQELQPAGNTMQYWTPVQLQQARPLSLPSSQRSFSDMPLGTSEPSSEMPFVGEGRAPTGHVRPDQTQRLFTPIPSPVGEAATPDVGTIMPQDAGTFGAPFSSSRLIPLSADLVYPYSTVGKLFFTIPGLGNAYCSASVLRPRVILTAGHCVHSGRNGVAGYYTNFLFVPAYRDGTAPYLTWPATFAVVTSAWAEGGRVWPNPADYALLEVQDAMVSGTPYRIGDVVGYLAYQTLSLADNHAHLLGYPCNLDSCEKLHQVTSASFRAVAPNNVEYGSDMGGGSSGGPWVQNFGLPAVGQTGGLNSGFNRVVGVTSYGYSPADPMVQGSAIFDARFLDLLNQICSHQAGNC